MALLLEAEKPAVKALVSLVSGKDDSVKMAAAASSFRRD